MTKDFTRLEAGLKRHIKAHPESVNTLYALALMNLNKNELGKSKEYFQELSRLAPNRAESTTTLV